MIGVREFEIQGLGLELFMSGLFTDFVLLDVNFGYRSASFLPNCEVLVCFLQIGDVADSFMFMVWGKLLEIHFP